MWTKKHCFLGEGFPGQAALLMPEAFSPVELSGWARRTSPHWNPEPGGLRPEAFALGPGQIVPARGDLDTADNQTRPDLPQPKPQVNSVASSFSQLSRLRKKGDKLTFICTLRSGHQI